MIRCKWPEANNLHRSEFDQITLWPIGVDQRREERQRSAYRGGGSFSYQHQQQTWASDYIQNTLCGEMSQFEIDFLCFLLLGICVRAILMTDGELIHTRSQQGHATLISWRLGAKREKRNCVSHHTSIVVISWHIGPWCGDLVISNKSKSAGSVQWFPVPVR